MVSLSLRMTSLKIDENFVFRYKSHKMKNVSINKIFVLNIKYYKKILSIIGLLLCTYNSIAQNNPRFINLNRTHGLSGDFISCISQDNYGYMWFGTKNGLNRYDGVDIDVYKHDIKNKKSLGNDLIRDVLGTSNGNLIVCSQNGIDIFDYKKENFEHITIVGNYNFNKMIEVNSNEVWILSNNNAILTLDLTTKQTRILNLEKFFESKISFSSPFKIFPLGETKIAIGTKDDKLFVVTPSNKTIKILSSKIKALKSYRTKFYIINDSEFWMLNQEGLSMFKKGKLDRFVGKGETKNGDSLNSDYLLDLKIMPNGNIWLFTDGGGINIYNPKTRKFKYVENDSNDAYSISSNFIYTSYFDKEGGLWLGSVKNGVSYLDIENPFMTYQLFKNTETQQYGVPIASIFMGKDSTIWVGSDGNGLYKFHNNKVNPVVSHESIKSIASVNEIAPNQLILGVYNNGISTLNTASNKLKKETRIDRRLNMKSKVFFVKKDSEDGFWVSAGATIHVVPNKNKVTFSIKKKIKLNAYSMKIVSKDTILFGTNNGLYRHLKKKYEMVSNIPKHIKWIHKYEGSKYWLGTNKGLCLMDIISKETVFYGRNAGLNNENVSAILQDGSNNLWVGTTFGISKFNIETKKYTNFTYQDGFLDNSFNNPNAIKGVDGKFYFGGTNGVLVFHPDSVKVRSKINKVKFTKAFVDANEVMKNDPNTSRNHSVQTITLNPGQKVLTVHFSNFQYKYQKKIKFSYKLEGYNKNWTITDQRSLSYMNLTPGNYTLKVKGSSASGMWNTSYSSVAIKVLPAWWQTIAFKIGLLILIVLVIYLINRSILKRKQLKNTYEFEKKLLKEQKNMDESQLRFFTNLSHEIRTPLSLILSPVEEIIKKYNVDSKLLNNLTLVQKNALRIERLVNRGIDFRKAQLKEPELQIVKQDLIVFLKDLVASFKDFSKTKNIDLILKNHSKELFVWFDTYMMETVFYNLLSNAFKYSYPNSKIIVEVFSEKKNVIIRVIDCGKGIPKEDINHVFERFYQSKEHIRGSGIGLAITKHFVKAHKGTISVTSVLKEGSCFEVKLPIESILKNSNMRIETGEKQSVSSIKKVIAHEEVPINVKLKNYTVLIVEDEPNLQKYLCTNLSYYYNVISASNGQEAFDLLKNTPVDVVVSDVRMPKMTGIEFCKAVRKDVALKNMPIILLTAKVTSDDRMEGYNTGANAYIEKPFRLDVLQSRINNLLESQMKIKNSILGVLDEVKEEKSKSSFYNQTIAILEKHMGNPDFGVSQFIEIIGVSKSVVYKKLKENSIVGINELLLTIRLNKASQLLIHTKKTIPEISEIIGFNNPKYLSTCFKKKFGTTPTKYRKEQIQLKQRISQ